MRQGDSTVDDFYAQMSAVWRQLDSIGPPYHPALVTRVRLRRLLWRLGALMIF